MGSNKHEESLVGQTFEKCRIIAKLGTGGMGSVWLAEHFGLGRKVAVKILPPEMGRDPEYVARFMREATTAGRMEHPNIVQIHDVGYAEGRHFIVMQYVDGESLSTVVDNLGAMDPMDAARIAAGMLRGLQHAHEEGVVHRDVKPDNVLITKGDEPKLLDFGLAIETETALQITKDGMVVGTPYYLAPEQARGMKATPLCDVYAAGVTLYYLLTGKRPFVGATALAVLNKHIHEPPVPPMKHRPVIPKPLNDIVLKMMAKKPADRYASAGAAADDLDAFLKGKAIQVRIPVQLPFGISTWTKRQQLLVASGAGGFLLFLVVLLILAFSGGKATPKTAVAPPPPPVNTEAEESRKFRACLELDRQSRENYAAYPDVFNAYDVFIASTPSADYGERGKQAKKAFYDFAEGRASELLDRLTKEPDPFLRLAALRAFPPPLVDLTTIDKRLREEQAIAHSDAETNYLENERKLDAAFKEHRFKEAAALLERLLPVAEGPRVDRLKKQKADLPRLEKEYNDEVLRRLTQDYASVHASFEEALTARETGTAFSLVARFLKDHSGEVERQRSRAPGLNYEPLLKPFSNPVLSDSQLLARATIVGAFGRAQDSLAYRILSDLQDAMDVEYLVTESTQGLYALARGDADFRSATYGATGRVTLDAAGLTFTAKAGVKKPIDHRKLRVPDLIELSAIVEALPSDQLLQTNDQLCRAIGAAWVYSSLPERWAQANRCFRQADKLGLPGLAFRIDDFRERGYQEVRDRITESRKELARKNFEGAKKPIAAVEAAWDHDPVLKEEIGRAMATILVAEVLHHERNRDYVRLKQAARLLRTRYAKLYPEEVIFAPYARAMRQTGRWSPAGSLLNDDWTWEGKAQGTPAPVDDETRGGRGLRLKSGKALQVSPLRSRGVTGASVQLAVVNAFTSFATGLRFDASDKDGRHLKLVVRDTGEVALYAFDGREEKRIEKGSLGKKLAAGQWIELSYVAEAGDLVCFVDQRPLILTTAEVPTDRGIELWTSADANFRLLQLRR